MRCWSSSEEKSFADTFSASTASVASVISLVSFIVLHLLFFYFAFCEAAVMVRALIRDPGKGCLLVQPTVTLRKSLRLDHWTKVQYCPVLEPQELTDRSIASQETD